MRILVVSGPIDHWNELYAAYVLCHGRVVTDISVDYSDWLHVIYRTCKDEFEINNLSSPVEYWHSWYIKEGRADVFYAWLRDYIKRPDRYQSPHCKDAREEAKAILSMEVE